MSIEGKRIIHFELLGSFVYGSSEGGETSKRESAPKAGKKTLSFLQYLIVNHNRNISSEELIERFWTDSGSAAPANALRHMLFKVRNLLKVMFSNQDDLLLTFSGYYAWNPNICLELDTEQFEAACLEAGNESEDTYCELLLQAIALYRGDFLSSNDSEWVIVLRQYYRALYLDACRKVLPVLWKKDRWMEIVTVCEQAYQIDFAVEDFAAYRMRALIALGQTGQAMEIYAAFRTKMLQEFELSPSEQIEQIYALAMGLGKKELGTSDIFKLVLEGDLEQQAFFCTFEMFQSIVALEKRHIARSKQKSSLVIVSLGRDVALATDTRRLERVLLEGLRSGDSVARLEAGSYILMLAGANEESAQLVMSRIDSSFHRIYRHSKACLTYRISALQTV